MPKSKGRGRSSERIAKHILEKQGYKILETNKTVTVNQTQVFEVDIVALSPEGERYCVEVKAGRAGVSDIRQVFANSQLLDLKPALVCKGFADEAAEAVAGELGVELIAFSDYYVLLEPDELEIVVRAAMQEVLNEYGFYPLPPWEAIDEEDWEVIEKLASAESFEKAAQHLQLSVKELGQKIGSLRKIGIFPMSGQAFRDLKRHSQRLIQRYDLIRRLERIEDHLKRIEQSSLPQEEQDAG